jgi:hypothetical protein
MRAVLRKVPIAESTPMLRHITEHLLVVVTLCSAPSALSAQDPGAYCRDTVAHARAISPVGRAAADDLNRLGSCGREGYQVVGELFLRARTSHDTGLLHGLLEFASAGDGLLLLDPFLTVAQDPQASTEARITAMIGLIQLQSGSNRITFHDLSVGMEQTTCGAGRSLTDQGGHPKTGPVDAARVVSAAKRIRADLSAPMEVRTGAACLGG